jgi:AmmeMemoRadiSam system protein B
MKVARDVVDSVIASISFNLISDPLAFAHEHSIEFPAVFIKALFPDRDVEVLPLIVSDLGGNAEAIDEVIHRLLEALGDRPFLPVAAVDLSHSGPRFGDEHFDEERVKYYDGEFMAAFSTGVPESLKALHEEFGNPTNIDAFGATYALMRMVEGNAGRVLKYDISYEEDTSSAVSFMAGALN